MNSEENILSGGDLNYINAGEPASSPAAELDGNMQIPFPGTDGQENMEEMKRTHETETFSVSFLGLTRKGEFTSSPRNYVDAAAGLGLEGDRHFGPLCKADARTAEFFTSLFGNDLRKQPILNWRQISLVSSYDLDMIAFNLGITGSEHSIINVKGEKDDEKANEKAAMKCGGSAVEEKHYKRTLTYGLLSENIVIDYPYPGFSKLSPGTIISFSTENPGEKDKTEKDKTATPAVLWVTGENLPCKYPAAAIRNHYGDRFPGIDFINKFESAAAGLRGVMAMVMMSGRIYSGGSGSTVKIAAFKPS